MKKTFMVSILAMAAVSLTACVGGDYDQTMPAHAYSKTDHSAYQTGHCGKLDSCKKGH